MSSTRPAKPANMSWISPILIVRDVDAATGFYEKAFGFTKNLSLPGPDGKTMHAEMRWQDTVFMVGLEMPDCPYKAPVTLGTNSPVGLYVYCEKVDAQYDRAIEGGAVSESAPQDMFWGDRVCTLRDPDGHTWHFATNVGDFTPEQANCGKK